MGRVRFIGNGGWRRLACLLAAIVAVVATGAAAEETPTPWCDGEQLVFALRAGPTAPVSGYAVSTIEAIERADGPGWRICFQTLEEGVATSLIEVHGDSFLPARTVFRGPEGAEVEAHYDGAEIRVEQRVQAVGERFGLSAQTYSAYQSLYLVRRFPAESGHQEDLWLVDPRRPTSRAPTVARVEAVRTVESFAGAVRATRTVALVGEGRWTFWVGTEAERLPYRVEEAGGATMELLAVRGPEAAPGRFVSPAYGYGIELPAGWTAFVRPGAPALAGRETVVFLLPGGAGELTLDRHPRFASVEQALVGSLAWLGKNRPGFAAEAPATVALGERGTRAAWFVGHYDEGEERRGLVHAVIETGESVLLLTGTAPEADFAVLRAGVAALLPSFAAEAEPVP